jgi:hypothetical protein
MAKFKNQEGFIIEHNNLLDNFDSKVSDNFKLQTNY